MTASKIEKAFLKAKSGSSAGAELSGSALSMPVGGLLAQGPEAQSARRPFRVTDRPLLDNAARASCRIIYPEMPDRQVLNSFRDLKTKLLAHARDSHLVIMITSVVPGGGGSFTAVNLAVAITLDQAESVVLLDCNLRNPNPQPLSASQEPGLTDYLQSPQVAPEDIVYPSGIERLWIVPSGGKRESPVEYFSSNRMRQLMLSLRGGQTKSHVLLDAHPATESADTRVLSQLCDQVLLVVPFRKVTERQIAAALEAVAPGRLLGIVFNRVP